MYIDQIRHRDPLRPVQLIASALLAMTLIGCAATPHEDSLRALTPSAVSAAGAANDERRDVRPFWMEPGNSAEIGSM